MKRVSAIVDGCTSKAYQRTARAVLCITSLRIRLLLLKSNWDSQINHEKKKNQKSCSCTQTLQLQSHHRSNWLKNYKIYLFTSCYSCDTMKKKKIFHDGILVSGQAKRHSAEHAGTTLRVFQSKSSFQTLLPINLQITDLWLHYHSAPMPLVQLWAQFSPTLFS